jgi:hypothetical protein
MSDAENIFDLTLSKHHPRKERKSSAKQLERLELWRVFNLRQGGVLPASLACDYLRISQSGLSKASLRGWICFVRIGRLRYYGKKDLENYRYSVSRKFPENFPVASNRSAEVTFKKLRKLGLVEK